MSKGLECLKFLRRNYCVLKRERENACDVIEQELKAIEIIKNYGYFDEQGDLIVHLPTNRKEENGLLKEVLL